MTNKTSARILVLGIGNVLMGDEGVGVRAVQMMEKDSLPGNVTLLDGGTGGFHLLSLFEEYDYVIMIDATMDGASPGTVDIKRPRFASDFPRTLSAHDIGLRDLLESAQLLGPLPEMFLVTVTIDGIQPMSVELSHQVARSLPAVAGAIRTILADIAEVPA